MRNLWLLPDRHQDGLARTVENNRVASLNDLLDLRMLPPELVLGIPEEVVRRNDKDNHVFGQYAKLPSGAHAFCLSCAAGEDVSGRTVFITNLQILSLGEAPQIPPRLPLGLPPEEGRFAQELCMRTAAVYRPIQEMLEAVSNLPLAKTFASERLLHTRFKPDWVPKKKVNSGLLDRSKGVLLLAIIATLLTWCASRWLLR